MVALSILSNIEAFQGLSQRQLIKLEPYCEALAYRQGDQLFAEGEPAMHLWVVLEGRVDLRFEMPDKRLASEHHTVTSSEAGHRDNVGQTFGWSCFVPPHQMRLSAYCVTDECRVVRIAREDLLRLFDYDPHMGYVFLTYLIKVVGYRFHQFQEVVAKHMGEYLMYGW